MKKYYLLIILLFLAKHLFLVNVYATENGYSSYIFRIKADSSKLTGFISKEMNGIITSLHGVAKRKSINAVNNEYQFSGLKIDKVDFDHDIALITSHELESKIKEKDGLNFLRRAYSKKDYEGRLYTIGYPIKMIEQLRSDNLSARTPFLRNLNKLLPEGTHTPMENRKSPNIYSEFISLEGHLSPGHSGSPILNRNDKVIGVASGGLEHGHGEICWAVPYNKIKLVPKSSEKQRLALLPRKLPAVLSALTSFNAFQSSGELLEWQEPRAGAMMDWRDANDYVVEKNREGLMGYHDWRLPAIGELEDLAKFIKNSPGSYSGADKLYWSSEDLGPDSGKATVVNLGNARMEWHDIDQQIVTRSKNNRFAVRLVRSLIQ